MAANYLDVELKELPGSMKKYKGSKRTMFLCNHTVVSDLFLAELVMEGQTNMIGRMLVFATVPLAAICSKFLNAGWFVYLGMK